MGYRAGVSATRFDVNEVCYKYLVLCVNESVAVY